jgi:hypothetical protein
MKRVVFFVALAACQRGEAEQKPKPEGYAADIQKICDVRALSGTDKDRDGASVKIAIWLGQNLKTEEGKHFLVEIQPLQGQAKADALNAEAKRNGLSDCALASEWH